MKVTGIRSGIVNLPADEPLAGAAANPSGKRPIVWVRVASDAGEGIGVAYFGGALTGTLRHAIDELGALAVGEDAHRVEGIHAKWKNAAGGSAGPGGVYNLAISALDMALWDIRGKALGQPLWKLLGGGRDRVPTYASGALMRELSLDRVVKAAATLKDKGWKEMKTQLALPGETNPRTEVERMVKIREAIGPDIKLMCDINQRWRPEQAVDIGKRVEDAGVGLFWLEDVTTADDYPGLARVSDALSTRVAGVTQWLKVAGMAEAFNLPVVSHLIPEVHVHLIGAVPNGLTVEYMPWLVPLFKEVPVQQNGELAMPTRPGLGLEFDQPTIERYRA